MNIFFSAWNENSTIIKENALAAKPKHVPFGLVRPAGFWPAQKQTCFGMAKEHFTVVFSAMR